MPRSYRLRLHCENYTARSLMSTLVWVVFPQGVLSSALQYRQCKAAVFQSVADELSDFEYVPWTSSGGSRGLCTLISKQFNITLESGVPEAKNVEGRGVLFEQVLRMADLLLDGYSCQLESLRQNPEKSEQYQQLKYEQE
ncbi:nuclear pore complex protein Nup133-like [Gigantopelta aegis]|uniref:nuclear pore complex protein Nup133-like n=1 Tax=Gigantopelta aegis TaxID=1735272 RepID=UPI001B887B59|nr:nuclear pore complex protein Nup133-like [Gigantopelta aegis]